MSRGEDRNAKERGRRGANRFNGHGMWLNAHEILVRPVHKLQLQNTALIHPAATEMQEGKNMNVSIRTLSCSGQHDNGGQDRRWRPRSRLCSFLCVRAVLFCLARSAGIHSQCGKNRNLRTHVSRLPSEIPSYRNFVPAEVVVTLLQSLWRKVMQGGSDMDAVTPG